MSRREKNIDKNLEETLRLKPRMTVLARPAAN
jgi:hypothetical protein